MHHRRRRQVGATTASLAVALTLAAGGCSDSEGLSSLGDCASPGVNQDEVRIGLIYPETGIHAATVSPARAGVEARIARANAEGGVYGRKLVVDWRDDESSPSRNLVVAKDLVEGANVFGLIEESATVAGPADYLAAKGVPVTGLAVEPVWSANANMFSAVYPYAPGATTTFGIYARQLGGTEAFLVSFPQGTGRDVAEKIDASLNSQGIRVIERMEFIDNITLPNQVAAKFAASGADVLAVATTGDTFASIVSAVRAAHITFKVAFGPEGHDLALLRERGAAVAGMSVYTYFTPFEAQTPGIQRYQDAIERFAPEISSTSQTFALNGYIGADLFVRGLELAGDCPTREGFIRGLSNSTYDADGLLLSPANLAQSGRALNNCYAFLRVNAAGTAFEPVPSDGRSNISWCGENITG